MESSEFLIGPIVSGKEGDHATAGLQKQRSFHVFWSCVHMTAGFSGPENSIFLKRGSIVGRVPLSFLKTMTTQPQLYPITFHSQWSFRLSSALQSLLHVLSGNEYKINFWLIRIMVVSQCVIFIWGGRNLSDPSVAKAFSGFVWKKLTCGHEIAATLSRACSLHWGVLFDQATYWGKKYLKDFSHLVVSIIISSCRL